MLARALRLSLLLEVALYVAIARYGFDASPFQAALLTLAGILSLRAVLILITYAYAWAWHSPAPPLSMWQALRMVLGEYAVHLLCFVLIFPFERWWMRPDLLTAGSRPPVLLVHGYGCSRAAWWWLRRRLQAAGWTVATINLEPVFSSIDDYIDPLEQRIAAVLAKTGAERLLLVGHSMGGLVARAYLQRCGKSRVVGLVTLGTPHQGSRIAPLGFGANARQMRIGSAWLQALASPASMLDTLAIYSPHDNYVMPQSNLQLPSTASHSIEGLGHLAMLYSPRVAQVLLAALDQTCARSA